MRVIEAFGGPVAALAVSADGRFLAATGTTPVPTLALWDWAGGTVWSARCRKPGQVCFSPDGAWLASCAPGPLRVWPTADEPPVFHEERLSPAGGVTFSPDGKYLVASVVEPATYGVTPRSSSLARWAVPTWQRVPGFDDHWPDFPHLTFSPNGEYIAGINRALCELRFAVSGGLQARVVRRQRGHPGTVAAFSPDSRTLVCGWDRELHVIETSSGRETRRPVESGPVPFRDGAFTGTGRHFGTVDETGVLKLWDAERWEVDRAYDWQAGPLTGVAFTADGLAGVCGTAGGQLILVDLD